MAIDDYDLEADSADIVLDDYVAARANAFGALAERMEKITSPEVREECMRMLRTIRLSVKTPPGADLVALRGGASPE